MKTLKFSLSLIAVLSVFQAFSQQDTSHTLLKTKTVNPSIAVNPPIQVAADSTGKKDIIDVLQGLFDKNVSPEKRKHPRKANFSIIPYGGYTLSTGFVADISGNVGFFTSQNHDENLSVVAADLSYDSNNQKIFLTRSEIWADGNKYKLVSDLRFEKYPTDTYGLGTFTTLAKDNDLDFYYLRVYETAFRKIGQDYYAGIGYNLDYHYDITATGNLDNTVSDLQKYGQTTKSTSSGVNFDLLFDKRKNPLNPSGGAYASIIFRENLTLLGSNANWRSLQLDLRKYFKISPNSNNILAFWSLMAFTSGNVPYLDLPATGGDMYNNSGRGYAVGRFRGKNELYLEGEYRFGLTQNGLLGAVIFANGESFSELQGNSFERIAPAAGGGLRIKINKHSNSNICIDYGVGTGGSRGLFVNLGEVF